MFALFCASHTCLLCAKYPEAKTLIDELVALADEKGGAFWKAGGVAFQGSLLALTGQAAGAVHPITSGITAWRSTGATVFMPMVVIMFGESICGTRQMR